MLASRAQEIIRQTDFSDNPIENLISGCRKLGWLCVVLSLLVIALQVPSLWPPQKATTGIIVTLCATFLVLGGGIAKHHLIGAAILRNGLDYAVYLSTGTEYDGSLSGARPREAVSWNKLKNEENSAFVEGDATLTFPLLACCMV